MITGENTRQIMSLKHGNRSLTIFGSKAPIEVTAWGGNLHLNDWFFDIGYCFREALDIRITKSKEKVFRKVGQRAVVRRYLSINTAKTKTRVNAHLTMSNSELKRHYGHGVRASELDVDDALRLAITMMFSKVRDSWTQGGLVGFKAGDQLKSKCGRWVVSVKSSQPAFFDQEPSKTEFKPDGTLKTIYHKRGVRIPEHCDP
ncbi:hypothetical protein [Photobacterium rosenbergii]|uniref:hypothetical protein n=1 Tax=Photobacterium rosenbergii TaxID=294936 RepID=UPI001C993BBE|nr:hypothetical protein [Photobacterium rosenbergii]MBY5944770.1 hypothetical protein [Photobacterium rosenbergii]